MENGNACQDNNAKPLSGLFTRKRGRLAQWANQHGHVSCEFLFNFLTQNGFRVESRRNYRGKRENELIRGCRSVRQKWNRVTPSCVFSRLVSALKQIKRTLSIVCRPPTAKMVVFLRVERKKERVLSAYICWLMKLDCFTVREQEDWHHNGFVHFQLSNEINLSQINVSTVYRTIAS